MSVIYNVTIELAIILQQDGINHFGVFYDEEVRKRNEQKSQKQRTLREVKCSRKILNEFLSMLSI